MHSDEMIVPEWKSSRMLLHAVVGAAVMAVGLTAAYIVLSPKMHVNPVLPGVCMGIFGFLYGGCFGAISCRCEYLVKCIALSAESLRYSTLVSGRGRTYNAVFVAGLVWMMPLGLFSVLMILPPFNNVWAWLFPLVPIALLCTWLLYVHAHKLSMTVPRGDIVGIDEVRGRRPGIVRRAITLRDETRVMCGAFTETECAQVLGWWHKT